MLTIHSRLKLQIQLKFNHSLDFSSEMLARSAHLIFVNSSNWFEIVYSSTFRNLSVMLENSVRRCDVGGAATEDVWRDTEKRTPINMCIDKNSLTNCSFSLSFVPKIKFFLQPLIAQLHLPPHQSCPAPSCWASYGAFFSDQYYKQTFILIKKLLKKALLFIIINSQCKIKIR